MGGWAWCVHSRTVNSFVTYKHACIQTLESTYILVHVPAHAWACTCTHIGCRCVVCKLLTSHNLSVTWISTMQTIFINRNQIISNGFTPTLVLINVFLKTQCWLINPSSWSIYPEDWPFQPAVVYPCKNSRKSVYLLLIRSIISRYGHFQ